MESPGHGRGLATGCLSAVAKVVPMATLFFDDPELPHLAAEFSKVDIPIRAINARDDKWASPESRDAFMSAYQSARLDAITVEPARLGMKTIGHMGYFRPQAEVLWKETLEWLTEQDKHPLSANHPAPTHTGIQL